VKVAAVIVLLSVALLAASCGGKKSASGGSSSTTTTSTSTSGSTGTTAATTTTTVKLEKLTGNPILGKKVWGQSKCGGCHTMKAAGSTGTIGADFDYLKPTQVEVAETVTAGGDVMPAYPNLTKAQVNNLAAYVYKSTS
jgi:cytochrome c6